MSRLRDETGAAAVFLAIGMVLLFGVAALAVDAGGLWTARRSLITDTDAAALAAAMELQAGGPAACHEALALGPGSAVGQQATAVFTQNQPGVVPTGFAVEPFEGDCETDAGRVTVQGSQDVPLGFAGVFGLTELSVDASSTAQWGPLVTITGLRPIALCVLEPHLREWALLRHDPGYPLLDGTDDPSTPLFDHPGDDIYPGAGIVHRVPFEKASPEQCGNRVPGNWGWLDFDGSIVPNGAAALRDRLLHGYDGKVTLGDPEPGDEDCRADLPGFQDCEGKSGANASTKDTLGEIVCPADLVTPRCASFPIVIFDVAEGSGSGALYHHIAFLMVTLRGFDKISAQDGYLDMEFLDVPWSGTVGEDPSGEVPTAAGVQLCGIDHDNASRCDV